MEEKELLTEETIPTEEAEVQQEQSEAATEPQEQADESDQGTESTGEAESKAEDNVQSDDITIRYLHEDLKLSLDEAKRYAQMGKHYEENVKETMESLDYLAAAQGKSVKEFVSELIEGAEKTYRDELVGNLGENNPIVEELMELRRTKNKQAYEEAVTERSAKEKAAAEEAQKSATLKLAEQFESLREVFPEYDTVEKVPDTVIKRAMKSGDLEKELLRFEKNERQRVEAAKANTEKNKNENIGSVQSKQGESGIMEAFLQGIRGR